MKRRGGYYFVKYPNNGPILEIAFWHENNRRWGWFYPFTGKELLSDDRFDFIDESPISEHLEEIRNLMQTLFRPYNFGWTYTTKDNCRIQQEAMKELRKFWKRIKEKEVNHERI